MEIKIIEYNNNRIAEVISENIILNNSQDALNLMADCRHNYDSSKIILLKDNIHPNFFDLKTKLAGDILQKFSTYDCQLAIIGDFTNIQSKSLHDFIYESNKAGRILFVKDLHEATEGLSGN